jgi:hypothetical protein
LIIKFLNKGKKIIWGLILLFLFIPIIQDLTHFVYVKPLTGDIEKVRSPEFSLHDWFERNFQEKKEKYLNQEFGLRNYLVRLHNQLCYWLFNEAHAKWVVVGKENYLYEMGYIDAYCGRDFIGEEKIIDQVTKLKFIQDTLKKLNKTFLFVVAPGKASFFPEYIPKKFLSEKNKTNYEVCIKDFKSYGINFVDFSSWFNSMKGKTKYPLYPQYGVHWSIYGATLAFDSLIHSIGYLQKIKMPELEITGYETPDTLRNPDDDVYAGMNLLLPPKSYQMAYPLLKINSDSTKTKPAILAIADSYFWNIYNMGQMKNVFSNARFWYYDKEIYTDPGSETVEWVSNKNLKEEINKSDVIIILTRNADIHRLGWGFIDKCYNLFKGRQENLTVEYYETQIKADKNWLKSVEKKAKSQNITLDSMVKLDAQWVLDLNKKEK